MNMKSLFALAVVTAAGAASASVTTGNTLCRIEVASTATNTIVAVPFAKVSDTSAQIPVTELVMTDNLSAGDTILHWNGSTWDGWIITVDSETKAKSWTATVISENLSYSQSEPAAGTALARGDAIWVNRSSTEAPFYIYGQVSSAEATSTAVAPSSSDAPPVATMMSAPTTDATGFQLNTLVGKKTSGNFADGDMIVVANPSDTVFGRKEYVYKSDKGNFCTKTETTSTVTIGGVQYTAVTGTEWTVIGDDVKVPVGEGFWYVSKGGDPTIKW